MTGIRIGIDVGGTFTDIAAYSSGSGELVSVKVPSTPSAPSEAVITGVKEILRIFRVGADAISELNHGTTVGTNTLLQKNGARTGLIVNEGFGDILTIGRLRLPDVYSFLVEKPDPITPRHLVKEVRVRRDAKAQVRTALDEDGVRRVASELVEAGAEAIAVCFLHAYRDAQDELRAVELIREVAPDIYACSSAEMWPEMNEYERAMVALISAHVGPVMRSYFNRLTRELRSMGLNCPMYATQGNGGVSSLDSAGDWPVGTLLSGPASGVVAAQFVAQRAGFADVVAIDMGGTSTEASIIRGDVSVTTSSAIGEYNLVVPSVDVRSLGAGGGSVAWIDPAGVLKVGPKSAGADPGPACYNLGGTDATVTDAYVVAGVLDPDHFLGGKQKLSREAAYAALEALGTRIGLSAEETASAILRIATANTYARLVPMLAESGVDPRDVAIVAYGGAGPTQAGLIADETGIRTIIVPPHPGTLCGLGGLVADIKRDFIRPLNLNLSTNLDGAIDTSIQQAARDLARQANAWFEDQRSEAQSMPVVELSADMRFSGQAFTIPVALGTDSDTAELGATNAATLFRKAYKDLYDTDNPDAKVQLVSLRATLVSASDEVVLAEAADVSGGDSVRTGTRHVRLPGFEGDCAVYRRQSFSVGDRFAGPAIVEQYDTTALIPSGFDVEVDGMLNLIARRR